MPLSRGLRAALVERDDFASGTSSRSSKLIHGGLRYLQQGDVRLVYEALAERQRLRRNAPHLVRILPFMIPILTRDGVMSAKLARAFGSDTVDVRPDRRGAHRQAAPPARQGRGVGLHAHAPGGPARLGLPVLRRPGRRRPALPHRRPHCSRPGCSAAQRGRGDRADRARRPDRRRPGGRRRPRGRGRRRGGGQRRRRVVGRRTGPRRRREPGLPPARQGHPRHRAVGEGAQRDRRRHPRAQGQAQPLRRALGRLHLRRHHRHGLLGPARRPAVHVRGHRVRAGGAQPVRQHRDHRSRCDQHVGRSAPPGQERVVRPHGRPLPQAPCHRLPHRSGQRHGWQAHDVPQDGGRRRRRRDASAGTKRAIEDEEAPAARCRRLRGAG